MPYVVTVVLLIFVLLVTCTLAFIVVRLWRQSQLSNFSSRAQPNSARTSFPKIIDALLALPVTRREKIGWLFFATVALLAIAFTGGF